MRIIFIALFVLAATACTGKLNFAVNTGTAAVPYETLSDAAIDSYVRGETNLDLTRLDDDTIARILFRFKAKYGVREDYIFRIFKQLDTAQMVRLCFRDDVSDAFMDGSASEGVYSMIAIRVLNNPSLLPWFEEFTKRYNDIWTDNEGTLLIEMYSVEKAMPLLVYCTNTAMTAIRNDDIRSAYRCKRYLTYILLGGATPDYYRHDLDDPALWRYGLWALYDNDTMTAAVIDTNAFSVSLRQGQTLSVFNGYGKSRDLYYANCRVKKLVAVRSGGRRIEIVLKDEFGWQDIAIPEGVNLSGTAEFKVEEIYPGTRYQDVCISEIRSPQIYYGNDSFSILRRLIREDLLPRIRMASNRTVVSR